MPCSVVAGDTLQGDVTKVSHVASSVTRGKRRFAVLTAEDAAAAAGFGAAGAAPGRRPRRARRPSSMAKPVPLHSWATGPRQDTLLPKKKTVDNGVFKAHD